MEGETTERRATLASWGNHHALRKPTKHHICIRIELSPSFVKIQEDLLALRLSHESDMRPIHLFLIYESTGR